MEIKFYVKIDVQSTLLTMEVGEEVIFATEEINPSSIRSAIHVLKKKGFEFQSTVKGLVDQVKVYRLS